MTNQIKSAILRDGDTQVTVLNIGCTVQDWQVAGRRVVLGHSDVEQYRENIGSMGIIAGRLANRTGFGRFALDGVTYQLPINPGGIHHLHGGPMGLGKQIWEMEQTDDRAVTLRLHSPDGDQGYPGAVDFTVRISLDGSALTWDMTGTPDRVTPIALCQHLYFNLAGQGTIRDHVVRLDAPAYTPVDDSLLPTGEILPVEGTRYDFREGAKLSEIDPDGQGYDLNLMLNEGDGAKAEVTSDGLRLQLWTDQPGVQMYTSNMLTAHGAPWPGQSFGPFAGLCLEAQAAPNTVNMPQFGSVLCSPDAPYRQTTTIAISPA